eukprot:11059308-Prorocentrum_lima.AAC.1
MCIRDSLEAKDPLSRELCLETVSVITSIAPLVVELLSGLRVTRSSSEVLGFNGENLQRWPVELVHDRRVAGETKLQLLH